MQLRWRRCDRGEQASLGKVQAVEYVPAAEVPKGGAALIQPVANWLPVHLKEEG